MYYTLQTLGNSPTTGGTVLLRKRYASQSKLMSEYDDYKAEHPNDPYVEIETHDGCMETAESATDVTFSDFARPYKS